MSTVRPGNKHLRRQFPQQVGAESRDCAVKHYQAHLWQTGTPHYSIFYGIFDGTTRTLRYVNAGHNPPLVIRKDRSVIRLEAGGVALGIFPSWTYEEGLLQLRPGDLIIAYTDGVTEAVNPAGEEWGVEGLRKAGGRKRRAMR